ncbi:MAG: flagellar motor switch protein FliN [Phycisphaerales bacterium]|nr:flagellar motor switch protein FliN [Phycisphaerales bacterium]
MADEAENTQPEEQTPSSESPEATNDPVGKVADPDQAIEDASAIAGDVAAQAEDGADMSDDEAAALAAAMTAINQATTPGAPSDEAQGDAFVSPEFEDGLSQGQRSDLDLLSDVHMNVRIELGRTRMFVEDVLRLGDGAVVELDKLAGDPVDVFVNDRKVARGEVLVLNDNFCVRISEIIDLREA